MPLLVSFTLLTLFLSLPPFSPLSSFSPALPTSYLPFLTLSLPLFFLPHFSLSPSAHRQFGNLEKLQEQVTTETVQHQRLLEEREEMLQRVRPQHISYLTLCALYMCVSLGESD